MKNIEAIFIDIDGTLVKDNGCVSQYTIEIIRKIIEKGIYVVLCSGRHNINTCKISKEINSSSYAISSNGALLYDYENDIIISQETLDFEDIKNAWNYFTEKKIGCFVNTKDVRYANNYIASSKLINKEIIKDINDIKEKDIYQIIVATDTYNKCKKAYDYSIINKNIYPINMSFAFKNKIKNKNYYFIDYVKTGVNKGVGIKSFLKYKNIDYDNTLCFGDHINDTDMFDSCKYKVAMENASEELKNKATFITPSNNEDGVAVFLEKYLL